MRICLITREYPNLTAYSGGIGTQFATLAPELARQQHDTHVIVLAHTEPAGRTREDDGVVAHSCRVPGWAGRSRSGTPSRLQDGSTSCSRRNGAATRGGTRATGRGGCW